MRTSFLISAILLAQLASALTVEVQVFHHSYCGRESGYAMAHVNGGVPPYTYEWSGGISFDFTCAGLFPGTYYLYVTDALMDQASTSFTIDLLPGYGYVGQFNGMARCAGDPAIVATFPVEPVHDPTGMTGPPPFSFNSAEVAITGQVQTNECQSFGATFYETLRFDGAAPGTYTVSFSDGNACAGTIDVVVPPELAALPEVQAVNVIPSCASPGTGSITFSFEGLTQHEYRVLLKPDGVADDCAPQVGTQWIGANTPSGTRTFSGLLPGDYWLVTSTDADRWFSGTPWSDAACKDSAVVTVPSLGTDCGVLSGRVYIDDDADCVRDGTENSVPATIVEITPGPYYVTTGSTGQYSIGLNYGTYTITEQNPVFDQSCGATATLASASQTVNVGCAGGEPLDVQLAMANGPARPGFQLLYAIDLDNLTPASTGAVTLTVTLDPVLGFLSANPSPATVVGNVVTWNLTMTQVFQRVDVSVLTQVPPDVGLIGTTFTTTALVTTANTDGNLSNNSATSNQLVTGSYDPNDKLAYTSSGNTDVWLLDEDEWIDYTIRFQNTGTDTAFTVVITDTLPSNLDPGSIIMGASSHTFTWELRDQGTLKFYYPNILLPDSNINEPLSHGFVGFRIRPRLPLLPGDEITNIANIYFDFNPPVITEPSVLNVVSPIRLDASAWLGGAYDDQTTSMRDDLRTEGLIPTTEPYTALGYVHSGSGGGETISPAVLNTTGANAIVDWVLVELRDPAQPATVLHSRSALLRRDGRITDKDGTSPVAFNAPVGNYRIALRHRNHLGAISTAPIALGSSATTWDIRTTTTALFGTTPTIVDGATRLLWPGDVNFNGQAKYTGTSNDRDLILQAVGGTTPTNVLNSVYSDADVNMDGQVKYTGPNNDRDIILQTIGGTVPTAVRDAQMP